MTASSPLGTALITGASAGIGATYAKRLAARGYDVLLVARRAERLQALAAQLRSSHGVNVTVLPADLSQPQEVERVARVFETEGITLLVNNAGVAAFGDVASMEHHALTAMAAINIDALVRLSQVAVNAFKRRNHGTIINIGSILGFHTQPFSAAYSGTKGYVVNFTRGLQAEVEGTAVVVQLVAPSATATDIWETSGVSLSSLGPEQIMAVDDLVDAALAGLDQGERITFPSVEDARLFEDYERARLKLMAGAQSGTPASRYTLGRSDSL